MDTIVEGAEVDVGSVVVEVVVTVVVIVPVDETRGGKGATEVAEVAMPGLVMRGSTSGNTALGCWSSGSLLTIGFGDENSGTGTEAGFVSGVAVVVMVVEEGS